MRLKNSWKVAMWLPKKHVRDSSVVKPTTRVIVFVVDIWQKRQRKVKVFGRVNMVPVGTKLFYLHLLLTHLEAPTSFDDLFCFQNMVHPTYIAACII